MANIPGEIVWQANDNTWFTTNAAEVYPAGITIYHVDGRYKFTDGVTALSALSFLGGGSGVQSVTGPQVDDTDPNNPIVNPLGLIKIVDLNGDFFTDLATAKAYVATFNVAGIISDESYNNGVYYFTVPQGSDFSGADYFLSLDTISTTSAYIVDENKLISIFGDYAFKNNEGNNIFSASSFGIEAFALASGINVITDSVPAFGDDAFNSFVGVVTFYGSIVNSSGNSFGLNSTGKFIILGKGSPLSCDATLFMTGATSTILVDKYYYTNNAGGIDACLANAITEGCNVQFDGINLEKVSNKSTSIVTDQASNIKYPSVKSVYDWVTTSNGYYNVKDYGAIGDGTTDDTTAILAAISASYIATGNVNLYFPNAVYKVNSQIEIDYPTANVNIVGNGSTLKSGITVSATAMLKVSSCSFLDIDNLKFNFNASAVNQYGLITGSEASSKRVGVARISRCDFYNFGQEGQKGILVENTPATSGLISRNSLPSLTINRCNFYNQETFELTSINYNTATLYGIGIELGEFSDNTIVSECNFTFIRIAIWSAAGANLTIANNNFIACFPKFLGSYSYGVIYVPNTGGNNGKINVIGNKINHNYGPCIYNKYATAERPMTISDNQFIANCTAPIQITHTVNLNSWHQIKNNYFERASQAFTQSLTNQPFGATLQPYIILNNQSHCKIKGNQFLNNGTYGVLSLNNANYNSVKNNDWWAITGISSLVGANNVVSDNDNL